MAYLRPTNFTTPLISRAANQPQRTLNRKLSFPILLHRFCSNLLDPLEIGLVLQEQQSNQGNRSDPLPLRASKTRFGSVSLNPPYLLLSDCFLDCSYIFCVLE